MLQAFQDMLDGLAEPDADDDVLLAAQELVAGAWGMRDRRRRVALAREALELSSDCADASLLLAEEAREPNEAIALCREAVEAGERALGDTFEGSVGEFWAFIETLPYMRARHMLALTLWEAGEKEEAVTHYRDMLRLNPDDNQGIRYLLVDALLALGRDEEAGALLQQYEEDGSAAWAWSEALLAFRRYGDGESSRAALAGAIQSNRYGPAYLLGEKKLPRRLPDFISPGEEDEAIAYVHGSAQDWSAAQGARIGCGRWRRSKQEAHPGPPSSRSCR